MDSSTCEKCGLAINLDQCPVCGQHRPCCGHVGEYCIIAREIEVGEGTRIWHWVKIGVDRPGGALVKIGKDCVIGCRVEIGPGVVIGDGTHVGADSQLHSPARIGRHVFIAPMVFLSNDKYPSKAAEFVPQPVTIKDHAIIGAGAQIMGGLTVGEGAFVGMDSLVTHDVPSGEMWRGSPARMYARRVMHWPGMAIQHWGPLCDEQVCKRCEETQLGQWSEKLRQYQRETVECPTQP